MPAVVIFGGLQKVPDVISVLRKHPFQRADNFKDVRTALSLLIELNELCDVNPHGSTGNLQVSDHQVVFVEPPLCFLPRNLKVVEPHFHWPDGAINVVKVLRLELCNILHAFQRALNLCETVFHQLELAVMANVPLVILLFEDLKSLVEVVSEEFGVVKALCSGGMCQVQILEITGELLNSRPNPRRRVSFNLPNRFTELPDGCPRPFQARLQLRYRRLCNNEPFVCIFKICLCFGMFFCQHLLLSGQHLQCHLRGVSEFACAVEFLLQTRYFFIVIDQALGMLALLVRYGQQ
mmetsp:Transcript_70863/g.140595  ORF Transcript_70863/g.140595 Transcript_70863/m.140595 type:complete len:293 (-) Transcript_70863:281-1159(-)